MMFIAFVVVLFGISDAATTQHPSQACCVAHKFTATMLELGANLKPNSTDPEFRQGYFLLDYDYDNQLSKLDVHTLDQQTGQYVDVTVYNDYPNDKIYTVTQGQCSASHINAGGRAQMTEPCVPSNFTFERTLRLGDVSAPLMIDAFSGEAAGERVSVYVQSGTCTPILETLYGERALLGDLDATTFMFADIQQNTLSSANPFALPDICKTGLSPVGK